jgi:hypothetical protein
LAALILPREIILLRSDDTEAGWSEVASVDPTEAREVKSCRARGMSEVR